MALRNDSESWGWPARLLHWVMAGLILFMLGLGWYMTGFVTDIYEQFDLFQTHKSWGFVVFALALVRIAWRLSGRSPDWPAHMPAWERLAARGAHLALYALMLLLPVSGWLMASASELQDLYGIRNMVFGLFELPDPFVPGDKALEDLFREVHHMAAFAMAVLVAGHVAAALKHHFVNRDSVLRKMIRGR